jgi:LuxR family maltose regulon positive regulatory protein
LHYRASAWFEEHGYTSAAIAHARAAGDVRRAAELVWAEIPRLLTTGRRGTIELWLEDFSRPQLVADPLLALGTAWIALPSGEPVEPWLLTAELALRHAERPTPGGMSVPGAVALLRAILAEQGARKMAADARAAYELDPPDNPGHVTGCYLTGVAQHLLGDDRTARTWLETGRALSRAIPLPTVWALCAAQLGFLDLLEGNGSQAPSLVAEAMGVVDTFGVQDYATMAPVYATAALSLAHEHRSAEAREASAQAQKLLDRIGHVAPWAAVEARVGLARAHLVLGDGAAASMFLGEADERLAQMSDSPALLRQLEDVRSAARRSSENGHASGTTLTHAEERVLRLLSTHMSFAEIGEQLYISRNTVKTQAISAYRKLGVHTRSAAVEKLRAMGLAGE